MRIERLLKGCFIVGVVIAGVSCSSQRLSTLNESAKKAYVHGQRMEKKQADTWKVIAAYSLAVQEDPDFYEALVALGDIYDRVGNFTKAYEHYGKALRLNVGPTTLYFRYGKALYNAGRFEEAYTYLELYHSKNPADVQGLEWLAETARVLRKSSAESYLLELTQTDSANSAGWLSLARLYYDLGEFDKAVSGYDKYAGCAGVVVDEATGVEYTECLVRTGRWNLAGKALDLIADKGPYLDDLRQSIEKAGKDSFDTTALIMLFDARRRMNSPSFGEDGQAYQGIYALLNEAKSLEPDFIPVYEDLASVSYTMGLDSVSIDAYERLKTAGRATAADLVNLGFLYFRNDDLLRARDTYEASLVIDGSQKAVKDYLVTIQKIIDGKIDRKAYRAYEKGTNASSSDSSEFYFRYAIELDSNYYEAYLHLGTLLMRNGKYKDAETIFNRGYSFVTDSLVRNYFKFQMGVNYYQMDFHDKAIDTFSSLLDRDSTDGDALSYLARTYRDKSDIGNAVGAHDRLIRLVPDYFAAQSEDLQEFGLTQLITKDSSKSLEWFGKLSVGLTNTYRLKILSKNDALLDADVNDDRSRELTITFREQVIDLTAFGEAEIALDILSVDGYAMTPKEKRSEGSRVYLRMSDVYGVTNIYGLMEDNPYSLPRLVVWVLEGLHGSFLRKSVVEGEAWKSRQYVFKIGTVDGVAFFSDISPTKAQGVKCYGILGSYDAARYGEIGRVTIHNKGQIDFELDRSKQLVTLYRNAFTTRSFHEADARLDVQEGFCRVELISSTFTKVDKPRKVVLGNIPYVKQHGPQCAAASLSMVLSSFGQRIDQDEIYSAIKSDFAGAQSLDIISYPRTLKNYKTFGYVGTLEDLKARIDAGIPVLVFLTPFGYGHVVVVIGYDESKHQIIMHDPTVANNQAIPYDDFLREWRQSGNECAIVVPFDHEIQLAEGAIATHDAVETKWHGDKAMGDHHYDKALELYRVALQKYPNYEGALEGIMLVHLSKDEFVKAEVVLDTLLALNPTSIDLILKRASLLLSQYDYDKVLQLTRKAKQLDESNIVNYLYTASALFSQKKYDEAIREVKEAIRINPLQSTPRNMLAGFLAEIGDFEQAYEQARLSIRYEPENAGNYITLSGLYLTEINNRFLVGSRRQVLIKKAVEATDQVRESNANFPNLDQLYADVYAAGEWNRLSDSLYRENIRKFPDENSAYNNLAWHMASAGRGLEEARQLSERSIELSQKNPYYFDTLAWIHLKMAIEHSAKSRRDSSDVYFRLAEAELKATIEYDRYSDFAYRHLGVVYLKWNRAELARTQFETVSSMLPDQARVWTEIAKDCEEVQLHDSALAYYLRALEHRPNLEYAAYRASYLMATHGRGHNRALDLIALALGQDMENFLYTGTRGVALYLGGNLAEARESLEKAIDLRGNLPDDEGNIFHYYLGRVYKDAGDTRRGQQQFREYLKQSPNGPFATEVRGWIEGKKN